MSMARALLPWVGLLAAVFLVIFAVPAAIEGLIISQDAPDYVSTRGEVKGQFEREHKLGTTSVIEFTYRVDGRKYYGSNEVTVWADDEDLLDSLVRKEKEGGKTLLVWFDPDNPRRAVVRRDVPKWPHLVWLGLTSIVLLWSLSSVIAERKRKAMIASARSRRPSQSKQSQSKSEEES